MTKFFTLFVRVISVPPVLVSALLILIYFTREGVMASPAQLLLSILFLAVLPLMAYVVAAAVPALRKKGREGQRGTAFVATAVGYIGSIVYGLAAHVGHALMTFYLAYFFSYCMLVVFNKLLRVRASGHACGIVGPMILSVYYVGWMCVPVCLALIALIFWSSLKLKRHTPGELAFGSLSAAVGFAVALLI